MQKGEVWIVEIPAAGGHEQSGLRPAIIIADTKTSVALVVPCTTNQQALRFPYTFRLPPSSKNGLAESSIALVLQLRAIDKRRLRQKIGVIEKTLMKEINQQLRKLLVL